MAKFAVYTFQFYPIMKPIDAGLFPDDVNPQESFNNKRELFDRILENDGYFRFKRNGKEDDDKESPKKRKEKHYSGKVVVKEREVYIGKIGKHCLLSYYSSNFERGKIDSYPNHAFIIANSEAISQILIQQVGRGFKSTDYVAGVLEDTYNSKLAQFRLRMEIRPRYHEEDFFNFVEKNLNDISTITFKLAEPNNPWVSGNIDEMANDMAKNTHSDFSFQLAARKDETMVIDRKYEPLINLVEASTKGGYPIIVTTKNRKRHECGKNAQYKYVVSISDKYLRGVEEGDLMHDNMDEIKAILRNIALQP